MRPLKDVIKELRQKHGNKAQVAKKIGISSQRLGQYELGRQEPKIEFFEKWLDVYKEDIRAIQKQTNVSREMEKPTSVPIEPAITGKSAANKADSISALREVLEEGTDYRLIPKTILDGEYRIMPKKELDKYEKQFDKIDERTKIALSAKDEVIQMKDELLRDRERQLKEREEKILSLERQLSGAGQQT